MKNKVIIVSGAAGGIGTAILNHLLEIRAIPIGIDIRDSELAADKKENFFQGDASNTWQVSKIIFRIRKKFGSINGLVNNAGLMGTDGSHGGRSAELFDKMIKSNTKTALVLTEACSPFMEEGGSIVNIGTIDLHMAPPDAICYVASKGALWGLTQSYSVELAKRGIRVNMVSPGSVATERDRALFKKSPALIKGFVGRTPLKRQVKPIEVAKATAFLLSDESSAITGQELIVDCGYTAALWDPCWHK